MALKSAEELAAEQRTRVVFEKRIAEIEEDLKSVTASCEALKVSAAKDAAKLDKLKADCQEATTQARAAKEELAQATSIPAGKPYLLQCVFRREVFPVLTQKWRLSGEFSDLPLSVEQACRYYGRHEGGTDEGSFWLQF